MPNYFKVKRYIHVKSHGAQGVSPWTKYSKTIQKLIFGHAIIIIIKSHSVQINTDPRKTLIWRKTLPWELFEKSRTATERFFTVDRMWRMGENKGKLYKSRARMTG